METRKPEFIPKSCGECIYFTRTGWLDRFKGSCKFYDMDRSANWECNASNSSNINKVSEKINVISETMNNDSRMGRLIYFLNLLTIFIINILLTYLVTVNEDSWPVVLLSSIALTIWALVCHVMRWHDLGKSGWYVLLLLIPIANIIILIYLLFAPGVAPAQATVNSNVTPAGN